MATPEHPSIDSRWLVETDRNGLVVLDEAECLRLLAGATLGRIGVTSGALPAVLPVNFWFDGTQILFRTGPGTKLAAATQEAVVAFEVDEMDPLWHTGWSVMVTGVARHITDPAKVARLATMPIARWAPRGGGQIVSITPELISGRRIEAGVTGQPRASR
ncbi:MAG: pyridoxamine 5'-phosphate oxidase family protein [Microthrixaceae bacterium]